MPRLSPTFFAVALAAWCSAAWCSPGVPLVGLADESTPVKIHVVVSPENLESLGLDPKETERQLIDTAKACVDRLEGKAKFARHVEIVGKDQPTDGVLFLDVRYVEVRRRYAKPDRVRFVESETGGPGHVSLKPKEDGESEDLESRSIASVFAIMEIDGEQYEIGRAIGTSTKGMGHDLASKVVRWVKDRGHGAIETR